MPTAGCVPRSSASINNVKHNLIISEPSPMTMIYKLQIAQVYLIVKIKKKLSIKTLPQVAFVYDYLDRKEFKQLNWE